MEATNWDTERRSLGTLQSMENAEKRSGSVFGEAGFIHLNDAQRGADTPWPQNWSLRPLNRNSSLVNTAFPRNTIGEGKLSSLKYVDKY